MLSKTKRLRNLGLWLMGMGLGLALVVFSWHENKQIVYSQTREGVVEEVAKRSRPVRLKIDKLSVDLPIEEGRVINDQWEVSEAGVSHWDQSVNPGEMGNVVIYGHNKNSLLGPIRWLEIGDRVEVINKDGEEFEYAVSEFMRVDNDDVSQIMPKDEEVLTMYTCDGFLDSERYVVVAE